VNPMTPDTTKTVCICTPSETTTGMTTHVLARRHSFARSSKWVNSLSEEMSFFEYWRSIIETQVAIFAYDDCYWKLR